jgi:Tol biopolymer transport system component
VLLSGAGAAAYVTKTPARPGDAAIHIATQRNSVYSSHPVPTSTGVFFESIAGEQYAIGRWDGVNFQTLAMDGHMFHPSSSDKGDRVYFERLTNGHSSIGVIDLPEHRNGIVPLDPRDPHDPAVSHDGSKLAFVSMGELYLFDYHFCRKIKTLAPAHDPSFVPGDQGLLYVAAQSDRSLIVLIDLASGADTVLLDSQTEVERPSISPDRRLLAFASRNPRTWQISLQDLQSHSLLQTTNGPCNSWSPAWVPGKMEIVFASDCNRGLNLPALFRMVAGARRVVQ